MKIEINIAAVGWIKTALENLISDFDVLLRNEALTDDEASDYINDRQSYQCCLALIEEWEREIKNNNFKNAIGFEVSYSVVKSINAALSRLITVFEKCLENEKLNIDDRSSLLANQSACQTILASFENESEKEFEKIKHAFLKS